MKKLWLFLLIVTCFLTACNLSLPRGQSESASQIMSEILSEFALAEGFVYESDLEAELPLTDQLLARMFPDDGDTEDLCCVVSAAAYFSKRFSEHEILIFEVCDLSHTEDITRLLQKRAKKKENAVVIADGVYIYLICTDKNEAISRYLKP